MQLSNNYKSTFIYSLKIVHIDQFQTQQDSRASLVALDRGEEIKVRVLKFQKPYAFNRIQACFEILLTLLLLGSSELQPWR